MSQAEDTSDATFLAGTGFGTLALFGVDAGDEMRSCLGHRDAVLALDVDWPSMRAVSGGADGALWLWNLADGGGVELSPPGPLLGCIRCLAADWRAGAAGRAWTGSDAGRVALWDFDEKRCTRVLEWQCGLVCSLAVDWQKMRALVGHGDAGCDLIGLEAEDLITSLTGHTCLVTALAVNWAKAKAAVGSGDGALVVWDVRKRSPLSILRGHRGSISAMAADWQASCLLSGSEDYHVRLWTMKSGECLRVFSGHTSPVRCLAPHWEAGVLASGAARGDVLLWDLSAEGAQTLAGTSASQPQPLLKEDDERGAITVLSLFVPGIP